MYRFWRTPLAVSFGLGAGLLVVMGRSTVQADDKPQLKTPAEIDQLVLAEIKQHAEVEPNLTHLSDVIGHRMTGSENLKKANQWAAEKFKAYGLENVTLEPWEIPAAWERGSCKMRLVSPDNGRDIHGAARAWTPGTKGKITGPVVVIDAKKAEDLKAYEGKLKNALVMLAKPTQITPITDIGKPKAQKGPGGGQRGPGAGAPAPATPPGSPPAANPPATPATPPAEAAPGGPGRRGPFQGGGMGLRQQITEMAQKEGAACLLTDSGKPHGLLNMTGSWRGTDRADANEPLPGVFITHDHYAMLYRLATRKDAPPPQVEVEIISKTIPGPVTVFNTVGEIKGTEKPDEFIVVGAHLDSWDLGQGTTDNGTGSSVVLESARALGALAKKGIRPKRTIRFVLFTGEEQGLHGSKEYVKRHKAEMAKTSMALVHDTGTGRVTEIPLQGFDEAKPVLEKELAILKDLKVEVVVGTQGGTDHLSFASAGVPGFAFHQDPAEYYLTHHTQSDTLDKARWDDLIQGSQVMSITAMRVANLPEMLPRKQTQRGPRGGGGEGGGQRRAERQENQSPAENPKPPEKKN